MTRPPQPEPQRHTRSLIRHIQGTLKTRTIMLTDIVHSTRFWSRHGDIQGRLMVDRHNRLLFPVVRRFGGRVVKTIGDAILAVFKDPDQALQAAVACQQILDRERRLNKEFTIKVRIGLHSGPTLVEHNDVFGDAVNLASRVEALGKGDDILLSAEARKGLKKRKWPLAKKGTFVPKGKNEAMTVFACAWREAPELWSKVRLTSRLPLVPAQRVQVFLYAAAGLAAVFLLAHLYVRFFLSENETWALVLLNPGTFWWEYPVWAASAAGGTWAIYYAVFKMKSVPLNLLRAFKGGFGFLLAFSVSWGLLALSPEPIASRLRVPLTTSKHLFVRTLLPDNPIYAAPSPRSEIVRNYRAGQLLLLADVKQGRVVDWNKVLIGPGRYGWVQRILPPQIGIPARRLTLTDRFYFRWLDLYALMAGLAGAVWGFFTFQVRPA